MTTGSYLLLISAGEAVPGTLSLVLGPPLQQTGKLERV